MKSELDIVFSFDDTGSMSSIRRLVRNEIVKLIDEIKKHVPTARIGIIIHNDYCDRDTIQFLPLTNDTSALKAYVNKNTSCGGGDAPECYELAINHFHEKFIWEADKKLAILIGDERPHEVGYSERYGKCLHDWKQEANNCAAKGIQIYSIQCLNNSYANNFYETVAKLTNGIKLELLQFQYILNYILGIFHKENDTLQQYEDSQSEFKTNFSLRSMFDKLFQRKVSPATAITADKDSIWKFQLLSVPMDVSIKGFVEGNGLSYKAGKGYYLLTKSETIQDYKEILMVNKGTDETISDTNKCREMLGIGKKTQTITPRKIPIAKNYDIYVQSTSYNRKLIGGTKFLYELDYK